MYTLLNGAKVENLRYAATGKGAWEQSQYFWYNGKLANYTIQKRVKLSGSTQVVKKF